MNPIQTVNVYVIRPPIGRCSPGFDNAVEQFVDEEFSTEDDGEVKTSDVGITCPDSVRVVANINPELVEIDSDFDYLNPVTYEHEKRLLFYLKLIEQGDHIVLDYGKLPNLFRAFSRLILTQEDKNRVHPIMISAE